MIQTEDLKDAQEAIARLSMREKIALDAYIFNPSSKIEAYLVAKGMEDDKDLPNIDVLRRRANTWLGQKGTKAYMKIIKGQILGDSQTQSADNQDFTGLTKPKVVAMLEGLIARTNNEMNKAKMLDQLAKIQGYQKEVTDNEVDVVRYYLPVRCYDCEFKKRYDVPEDSQDTDN